MYQIKKPFWRISNRHMKTDYFNELPCTLPSFERVTDLQLMVLRIFVVLIVLHISPIFGTTVSMTTITRELLLLLHWPISRIWEMDARRSLAWYKVEGHFQYVIS